jgi:hypothetical protein
MVLGLWFGYSLGYHHSSQDEWAAWKATEVVELDRGDVQLVRGSKSSDPAHPGRIKLVQSSANSRLRVYYADPQIQTLRWGLSTSAGLR